MRFRAAAKGRRLSLLAAVFLISTLLAATAAEASRSLPAALAPALEAPVAPASVLAETPADPQARYRLFGDLSLPERPLELVQIQKTASGVSSCGLKLNIQQTGGLSRNCGGPSFQGLWTDPVTGIAYARNRWYDARTASWLSEDPMGAVDSTNLYAFAGWGPHQGRDPLGLSDQPYNLATGPQAHTFFSRWLSRTRWYAARNRTGDVYLNKSVRIALRDSRDVSTEALRVPFEWDGNDLIKVLASDLIRPDVAYLPFVSEELGEIYELKPITQNPAKGKAQLDLYVLFFEINDVSMLQGDFAAEFPDSLEGFEIPGTVVDWDGQPFKIRICAPEVGSNSGLVNYELVPVDEEDYERAYEQALDWALEAVPDLADRERGAVAAPIGSGGGIIVQPHGEIVLIGTGLAAALTAIEALISSLEAAAAGVPIIIIDPCVLDPHGPFCGPQQGAPGGA